MSRGGIDIRQSDEIRARCALRARELSTKPARLILQRATKFNRMAKATTKFNDMHDYNVMFDYPASGDYLDNFTVLANNLKDAKAIAQFSKRMYCRYDKPSSIPANRIRVIVKRIFSK